MSVQEMKIVRTYHAISLLGLTFCLVGVVYGCSARTSSPTQTATSPTPTSAPTVTDSEMLLREETIRRALNRQVQWAKLDRLQERSLGAQESETRIWVGFDGAETPGFIFRTEDASKSAEFISTTFPARGEKVTPLPVRKQLRDPKSGWVNFEEYLKEKGISNPLRFFPDRKHVVDPDEGSIVIETKTASAYSMVFFALGSETEDGKRAFEICRKIEYEFEIKMRCGETTADHK